MIAIRAPMLYKVDIRWLSNILSARAFADTDNQYCRKCQYIGSKITKIKPISRADILLADIQ